MIPASNRRRTTVTALVAALVIALITLAGCGGWTKRDTLAEAGFAAFTTADWVQTNSIVSVCDEDNSIIGECGENIAPNLYFPVAIALHAAIAAALPPRWRLAWQAIGAGAELNQVWHNTADGYDLTGSIRTSARTTIEDDR